MKALIISDDNEVIETLESFLSKNNIETIVYNWFIKALDNIEEIRPDLLIINGEEYPRHWKILSQFAKSNLIGKKIPVFVYTAMSLNEDDENKIKTLKNTILISSLKTELLNKLTEKYDLSDIEDIVTDAIETKVENIAILSNEIEKIDVDDLEENNADPTESIDSLIENKQIILRALINSNTNKKIVIGNVIFNSFEDMKIKFIPDYPEDLKLFNKDSSVHDAFYEYEKDCIHFNAKVLNININKDSPSVDLEFLE